MLNLFSKIIFLIKRPKVIIIIGKSYETAGEAVFRFLDYFSLPILCMRKNVQRKCVGLNFFFKNRILLIESDLSEINDLKWIVKKSSLPIVLATNIGDIPSDRDFFASDIEETKSLRELAENIPSFGHLILNFDDETVREIKNISNAHNITFGFQDSADFKAGDVVLTEFPSLGTNFKLNYQGNMIPIWLKGLFGKEQIYAALGAFAVGELLNFNSIKVSEALRSYSSVPGKMRLIKGIKNSLILDDCKSSTVLSMIEAIEILGKIPIEGRKIAVLGDIIGIGKYTIEAHETIGEKVASNADLLFTFGGRAKFIAQGALKKGMGFEKIFQFDTIEQGKLELQNEIKKGDIILIDGSAEMDMNKIVEEIYLQEKGPIV